MALSDVSPKIEYTADGVLTGYTYPFRILASEDIKVYIDDIEQGSGFTVSGVNNPSGGTVTFTTAPANNAAIKLQRFVTKNRSIDYVNGGKMDSDTFDQDFDRTVMMVQDEHQVLLDKIVFATSEKTAAQLAQSLAETAQTAAELAETNAETAETNSAASAAASASSATASATSATNASTSETNAAASATAAANSATASANSATASATSATNSATSETNSANSATASANSATASAASAAAALTSETNAAASEVAASTSASNAAASEAVVQGIQNDINFNVISSDVFTGNGAQTVFTLAQASVANRAIISVNGLVQEPTTDYTISGTTLTFTTAPANTATIEVRHISSVVEHGNSHTHTQYASLVATSVPDVDNTHNLGSATNRFANFYATTLHGTATSAQYADLAEKYSADKDYEPGTVVGFGGEEEVTADIEDSSTKQAGVISTRPAFLMNSGHAGEYVVPVAFTGRVPCKVTGKVSKGDMMVAAGNGVARAEANPVVGSVIGKALADFNGLRGTIEVVVGRY